MHVRSLPSYDYLPDQQQGFIYGMKLSFSGRGGWHAYMYAYIYPYFRLKCSLTSPEQALHLHP